MCVCTEKATGEAGVCAYEAGAVGEIQTTKLSGASKTQSTVAFWVLNASCEINSR